jgi:acetylornithine deacetylase/succinyl-diaminopimelate desuccinylase-like protein
MRRTYFTMLGILATFFLYGQKWNKERLETVADQYAKQSWQQFFDLLSIPNDAHFPEQIEQNMIWCEDAFGARGFITKRLETDRLPLLLAERKTKKPKKTVLIYLQLDGQPVDSSRWFQETPFTPTLKSRDENGNWQSRAWSDIENQYDPEMRIFARAASDAKGPVSMFLAAVDAAANNQLEPNYDIKVIMDFEEELGSPPLPAAVEKYKEELAADMLIIYDGPRHVSNQPTLTFGARGIATITLTLHGPRKPQHSGHYGNYAPNPAFRLAKLLASMKDEAGRVTIDGYYDGIELTPETKEILSQVPDDEAEIMKSVGIAATDKVGSNYQEAIQYPSLNIRGMSSGWVGDKVRTIVPATATAEIDVRLVMETDPERLLGLIRDHIEARGYYITSGDPTEEERMSHDRIIAWESEISYLAYRTPFESEVGVWLEKALTRAFDKQPIKIRNSGGSIPISPFVVTLGIPAVTVPTVNRDNNQHSPNENIRLGNYVEGVQTFLAILSEKF